MVLILAPAVARTEAAPQNIRASETPWTVSCLPIQNSTKVDCSLGKQLRTTKPVSLVAQISVLLVDGKLSMRVIAPHQMAISEGLSLQIDGKDVGTKQFTTSVPGGIVSLFRLDEDFLAEARRGQ